MKRSFLLPILLMAIAATAVFLEARAGSIAPVEFLAGFLALLLALACVARAWERARGPARALAVAGLLGATHLLVHASGRGESALYSFYFLPILAAARFWGLRGSTLVGVAVTVLYATFFFHATMKEVLAELLEETVTLLFIALLTGELVDRLRQEEALRRDAERSEIERARLAETGLLAAQVAHEFRNPLQVIAGGAETMSTRGWIAPEGRGLLEDLANEARRMEVLVGDFLAYGRPRIRLVPNISLDEVIERAGARVAKLAVVTRGVAPRVSADAEALERVFFNLLRNAAEAGAKNAEAEIEEASGASPPTVRVRLRDDGPGVPEQVRSTVFQPFRTGRPGGVGLGLAIARRIIEAHGGRIDLLSSGASDRKGAAFRIDLPIHPKETPA